jgi:hypothetical protein
VVLIVVLPPGAAVVSACILPPVRSWPFPAHIGLCALRWEKWTRSSLCKTILEPRRHHPALSGKVRLIFIIVYLNRVKIPL